LCTVASKLSKIFRRYFAAPFFVGVAKVRAFLFSPNLFSNYFDNFLVFYFSISCRTYRFFEAGCKDKRLKFTGKFYFKISSAFAFLFLKNNLVF